MPSVVMYLLKLSVCIAAVYAFYRIVLHRLTFYHWNRAYLLLYTLLCFFLPLINLTPSLQGRQWSEAPVVQFIPTWEPVSDGASGPVQTAAAAPVNPWAIVMAVLMAGMLFFAFRLVIRLVSYLRLRRRAILLGAEPFRLYRLEDAAAPFSFGQSMFLNPDRHSEAELKEIIAHEFVHIRQRHTLDILWMELFCLLNWYNPFAWLLRRSVRRNLEYLADDAVIRGGTDRRYYQYLLLKLLDGPSFRMTTGFSFTALKKRIVMMNAVRSARASLLRFLFLLPLVCVLLLSFREQISEVLATAALPAKPAPEKKVRSDIFFVAGLVLDPESFAPKKGFPLKLLINNKTVAMLRTDANGFYYYADDLKQHKGLVQYELALADAAYYPGSGGTSARDSTEEGYFQVTLAQSRSKKGRSVSYDVQLPLGSILAAADRRSELFRLMQEKATETLTRVRTERQLRDEFLQAHPEPREWITEYKGYLFWKSGRLIARKDSVHFYLFDDEVGYEAINRRFRNSKDLGRYGGSYREDSHWRVIYFEPEDETKLAPPATLVSGNAERLDLDAFVLLDLRQAVLFENGHRRSRFGPGSWMLNRSGGVTKNSYSFQKKNIRSVYRFTGALADYYVPGAKELYWIEFAGENVPGAPALPETTLRTGSSRSQSDSLPLMKFVADSVQFTLSRNGSVEVRISNVKIEYESDRSRHIQFPDPSLILLNGKEVEIGRTYGFPSPTRFVMYRLGSADAVRKYGAKAKSGAMEVYTEDNPS